jgi:hypothetical protein
MKYRLCAALVLAVIVLFSAAASASAELGDASSYSWGAVPTVDGLELVHSDVVVEVASSLKTATVTVRQQWDTMRDITAETEWHMNAPLPSLKVYWDGVAQLGYNDIVAPPAAEISIVDPNSGKLITTGNYSPGGPFFRWNGRLPVISRGQHELTVSYEVPVTSYDAGYVRYIRHFHIYLGNTAPESSFYLRLPSSVRSEVNVKLEQTANGQFAVCQAVPQGTPVIDVSVFDHRGLWFGIVYANFYRVLMALFIWTGACLVLVGVARLFADHELTMPGAAAGVIGAMAGFGLAFAGCVFGLALFGLIVQTDLPSSGPDVFLLAAFHVVIIVIAGSVLGTLYSLRRRKTQRWGIGRFVAR